MLNRRMFSGKEEETRREELDARVQHSSRGSQAPAAGILSLAGKALSLEHDEGPHSKVNSQEESRGQTETHRASGNYFLPLCLGVVRKGDYSSGDSKSNNGFCWKRIHSRFSSTLNMDEYFREERNQPKEHARSFAA